MTKINKFRNLLVVVLALYSVPSLSEERSSTTKKNLQLFPPEKVSESISHPKDFKVKYNLKNTAEIAVNILNENYFPVSTFIISAELEKTASGTKKGKNKFYLWDGKDMLGKEAPAGEYYAVLSVVYKNGKKETIGFVFVKE